MVNHTLRKVVATASLAVLTTTFAAGCGNNEIQQADDDTLSVNSVTHTDTDLEKSEKDKEPEKVKKGFEEGGKYINDTVSYDYGDGKITVGTDHPPDDEHIYLNVSCSEAADGNEIGYYLESSRIMLEHGEGNNIGRDVGDNAAYTNFLIIDRLYDNLIPITCEDENQYGVRWADNELQDGNNGGTTISIRAVNLATGAIVAMCDAVIEYDSKDNTYEIAELKSSDVKDNKELDDTSRTNIVNKAAKFASERVHTDVSDFDTASAIVDKHDGTYFSRFLDEDDTILYYKDYTTCKDTYAVTVPSASYGFVTVYFAPQTQLIGMTSPHEPGKTDLKLKLYGYDAVRPIDTHSILAPQGFLY